MSEQNVERKEKAASAGHDSLPPPPPAAITMDQLLVEQPLHSVQIVSDLFSNAGNHWINYPENIRVHCAHNDCVGIRRHHKVNNSNSFSAGQHDLFAFVEYRCTDCRTTVKVFGVRAQLSSGQRGKCVKIYEEPPFGHPIPKRLFQVIGEANRDSFLQARRAIARGLGIGAYAYYRRIVENTKFDLVGSVLEVARATNAPASQIGLLQKAQTERRFSKAIETLRDGAAIPAVLLIDGHNPLTLLHDLLSEGIHELTDQQCLERAQEAEVILCEIADRMQIALTERKTVKAAISSIMKRKATNETAASISLTPIPEVQSDDSNL
jgi:hypothetical protein